MKKSAIGIIVLFVFSMVCTFAQKPAIVTGDEKGWYKIGTISASFKKETESIIVMGKDEFATIKPRVSDSPINIERVVIHFEGGKLQEVDVKQPLKPGEETREIVLDAENKEIDKVEFTYHTVGNAGEKAEVELFGFKAKRDGENSSSIIEDKDRDETRDDREIEENAEEAGEDADEAREDAEEAMEEVEDEAEATRDNLEDAAEDAANEAEEAADDASDEIEEEAEEAGDEIEEGSQDLRDDIKEGASKAKAEITDNEFEDKVGPNGQTVYIDDEANYYWIDEGGNKHYISALELRDK